MTVGGCGRSETSVVMARSVDRRSRRVLVLLTCVIVLSAADLVLTLVYLRTTGMMEANPIAAQLIRSTNSAWLLAAFKASTVAMSVALLFRLRHRLQGEIGCWCALAILAAVSMSWRHYAEAFDYPGDVQLAQSGFYGDHWLMLD